MEQKPYGQETFRAFLEFNDEALERRLELRDDGVRVRPLAAPDAARTPEELRLRLLHPSGNLDSPALPFPFSADDFLRFCQSAPCSLMNSWTFCTRTRRHLDNCKAPAHRPQVWPGYTLETPRSRAFRVRLTFSHS